jgi:extracellular factor (EF) 3-hydroxypalmitic acid methyl ester biosynthesis protein
LASKHPEHSNNQFVLAREMFHSVLEMSQLVNGNGNGNGAQGLIRQLEKKAAKAQAAVLPDAVKESHVAFHTAESAELRGTLTRLTRHAVVFELYNPGASLRLSEALDKFAIVFQERTIYSGRAVVRNVVSTGSNVICEAMLNEADWRDVDLDLMLKCDDRLVDEFTAFIEEWQKLYKVQPKFKEAVADIKIFLTDLRLWLEQIESGIRSNPKINHARLEGAVIDKLSPRVNPVIDTLFEKFEKAAAGLDEEMRPAHRNYIQRHLHSIILCAPFASRTYQKPLGYAGDYEMVNMMARDPKEGASVFAKMFNVWLLHQGSAEAHRNRLAYLTQCIERETLRVSRTKSKARIYNFACGPAMEVQRFLDTSPLSEQIEITLADFNGETLEHTRNAINNIKEKWGWRTSVQLQKKTVHQLIKENQKAITGKNGVKSEYDFVYCAGLFDYLPDNTCSQLIKIFHGWLAPGGLLLVTNVTPSSLNRGSLELILDWHLIYRDSAGLKRLCSGMIPPDQFRVHSDATGVNMFLEVRKSDREE